ncbi:LexA family protein [Devosia naphthalenivorans]|uniref:LexA family protein n=1 Tax=Devosia naphthalenivorans TaxID=2082392 RepID=UPI001FEA886F|nr:helix-turn-helix domain-containing protein [Devosia naphthalenivorans]
MLRTMKWWQRLQSAIDELGWTKAELQRRSGISYDSINKYLRGDVDNPRGNVLEKLAATIDRPAIWLKEGVLPGSGDLVRSMRAPGTAPVVATVEAGAWREVDELDQDSPEWVTVPADDKFPDATQRVYDVAGDSMNALQPHPITPGSRLVAIDYDEIASRSPLRNGLVVVIQRSKNGGQERELSVKQVAWFEDRIEFQPRSTNPKHKPIVVEHDNWEDNGVEVAIVGLVRDIIHRLPG